MNLINELKRRKVFRVAAVYAVVAWLLIQVADVVLPTFGAPGWVNQTIIFLFLLGFVPTLIAAWAYEITPEGIEAVTAARVVPATGINSDKKLIYAIFILVLLVAGFQIADRILPETTMASGSSSPAITENANANTDVVRSSLNMGSFDRLDRTDISISPDGRRIYYTAFRNGTRPMLVRDLDSFEIREIGDLKGNNFSNSSFSPDGEWLVFTDEDGLSKIAASGGQRQILDANASVFNPQWVDEDTVLYSGKDGLIYSISPNGGVPQSAGFPEGEPYEYHYPFSLPDNKGILAAAIPVGMRHGLGRVVVLETETQEVRTVAERGYAPLYTPSGHLLYTLASLDRTRENQLIVVPLDLDSLTTKGLEFSYGQQLAGSNLLDFAINGRMVVNQRDEFSGRPNNSLFWVDRSGEESQLAIRSQPYLSPRLSPNEEDLALIVLDEQGTSDLWVYNFARSTLSRLTYILSASSPIWNPDGNSLIFGSGGEVGLWQISANGAGDPVRITDRPPTRVFQYPHSFVPNSDKVIFGEEIASPGRPLLVDTGGIQIRADAADLSILSLDESSPPQPLIASENFREFDGTISPDSNWIAYTSDETGNPEVYVRPFPDVNSAKWQVSSDGGISPHWRADGGELVFVNREDGIVSFYAVAIETEEQFSPGSPELLFSGDFNLSYDATSDHRRFLLKRDTDSEAGQLTPRSQSVTMVENWFEELKRVAPRDQN